MSVYWLVSFLFTSLDSKFTLAARARAGGRHTSETRRGRGASGQGVERVANLPLLARLASVVLLAAVAACSDHWPVMLNRWFGWLSSPAPTVEPTTSVTEEELGACEESSDEGSQLGSPAFPRAHNVDSCCRPCARQDDGVSARDNERHAGIDSSNFGDRRTPAVRSQCLFAVLTQRCAGHQVVPCVRGCRGQRSGREDQCFSALSFAEPRPALLSLIFAAVAGEVSAHRPAEAVATGTTLEGSVISYFA